MALPKGRAGYKLLYRGYIKDAVRRDMSFRLSLDEFILLVTKTCSYCGMIPRKNRVETKGTWIPPYNGIDRIDPKRGYSIDNCVPCCKACNKLKGTFSLDEFLRFVGSVYEKYKTYIELQKKNKREGS